MKKYYNILVLFTISIAGFSQSSVRLIVNRSSLEQYIWSFSKNKAIPNEKSLIDFDVMDNWKGLGGYLAASDDGNYFAYSINKMVFNAYAFGLFKVDSLIVQSTQHGQRKVFASIQPGSFTADSKQYIFQDGETLCFLQLGGGQMRKIANVASYKISQNRWLAYQMKGKDSLRLQNLVTGKEKQFAAIADYNFSNNGEWLICQNKDKELILHRLATGTEKRFASVIAYTIAEDGKALLLKSIAGNTTTLQYISLPQGDNKIIWTSKEKAGISSYSLDGSGKKVLFNIVDSTDANNSGIWYYEAGKEQAVLKITNQVAGIPLGVTLSNASFTADGKYIRVSLQTKPAAHEKPNADLAGLEVWNHKDLYLQSVQDKLLKQTAYYNAVVNIETGKLVFLESTDKKLAQVHGDFAIVQKNYEEANGDRFWEQAKDSVWIFSLKDDIKKLLSTTSVRCLFSPSGNYLVYFDNSKAGHYYSYDLITGVVKNISADVTGNQIGIVNSGTGIAAWIDKETAILVYDNYDIWKLDLTGNRAAVNVTNGFGKANNIAFSLFETDRNSYTTPVVKTNEILMLRAFNRQNKQIGYFRKSLSNSSAPEQVIMGNYFMSISGFQGPNTSNFGLAPVKVKNSNAWIVQRQSFNDAPNYFETTDFKNFKRLTNFQPQQNYQWLREELMSFKHIDGEMGQGILFKPENFDPTKKYPVVIVMYENFSDNMHQFRNPSYIDQSMEIGKSPIWFLNNGYLVFTPDIVFAPSKYGPKAYSIMEGAAQYLKQLPYVDGNKLGCVSHSASAKLGVYLFTHSKSITATSITEGFLHGNMINVALSANSSGMSKLSEVESEMQMGNIWENKDQWLDHTTVLNIDKVVSPLLLLCNKESSAEYQDQTQQIFTALRRLDKNAWWLKYDKGGHTLNDQKELKDYTIRYTQFFDHYLKNAPAPQWMTQGIPLKLKGIESRYELDAKGTCNAPHGEACLICEAWNKQYKRTATMFEKEISEWVLDKDIAEELERKQKENRKELDKQGEIQTKEVMKKLNTKK